MTTEDDKNGKRATRIKIATQTTVTMMATASTTTTTVASVDGWISHVRSSLTIASKSVSPDKSSREERKPGAP